MSNEIDTGYIPRVLQYKLHEELRRFNVIVCHRRFGKTIFSINHMIDRAMRCTLPMPRYAYIAPTYGQAKRVVWDQLKHYTSKIPGAVAHEQDLRVDLPGGRRIMLLSAENPVSLKGIYLDGVILDEYAEMNPAAWSEVVRPTLSDRKGWAVFIGTPKGQNSFHELYTYATSGRDPDWYGALYKASQTGIISQEELDSNKRTMTEDEYEQEFECSFVAALSGAYFGKELQRCRDEGRIRTIGHDPATIVDTYWDLGLNDVTAIWFGQTYRGRTRFIDYYEICGAAIPDVVADIQKKGYVLGRLVLPHDAKQRNPETGRSQQQVFYSLGFRRITIVPRVGTKRESINAARMAFPLVEFDAVECEEGLKFLGQYQRKWNPKANTYEDSPLHNHASNCADAFQQFALAVRENSGDSGRSEQDRQDAMMIKADTDYSPFDRQRYFA